MVGARVAHAPFAGRRGPPMPCPRLAESNPSTARAFVWWSMFVLTNKKRIMLRLFRFSCKVGHCDGADVATRATAGQRRPLAHQPPHTHGPQHWRACTSLTLLRPQGAASVCATSLHPRWSGCGVLPGAACGVMEGRPPRHPHALELSFEGTVWCGLCVCVCVCVPFGRGALCVEIECCWRDRYARPLTH
jgi:hypothetical protein